MDFLAAVDRYFEKGIFSQKQRYIFHHFYKNYSEAVTRQGREMASIEPILCQFIDKVVEQSKHPYQFEIYHQRITEPFDYHRFGLDFFRPLIDFQQSTLQGDENIRAIERQIAAGENVILFGNHQIEPDPQIIDLLLEKRHKKLSSEIIFVAGHRVVSDPMAIPFSMGRNLLCIFSKKYIDHPPEEKAHKISHNQKTMKKMVQLLNEGGKCIYVAPSGGRDRPNAQGHVEVDLFDAQSVEMFYMMSKHATPKTHFYPLALATYDLTPPPKDIQQDLGELRTINFSPVHVAFGTEIDMEGFESKDISDKKELRQLRADHIWNEVKDMYAKLQDK